MPKQGKNRPFDDTSLHIEKRNFIRDIMAITLTAVLSHAGSLAMQAGASSISKDCLATFLLLYYIPTIFVSLGFSIGEALLVLLARRSEPEEQNSNIGGGILFCSFASVLLASTLFCLQRFYIAQLGLGQMEDIEVIFLQFLCLSISLALATLSYFLLISLGSKKMLLKWEIVGAALAVLGVYASVKFGNSAALRFKLIILSGTLIQMIYAIATFYAFRKRLSLKISSCRKFIISAKHIILGDFTNKVLFFIAPLLFSLALVKSNAASVVVAFSIGTRLLYLARSPLAGMLIAGTSWLSAIWEKRSTSEWDVRIAILSKYALLIVVLPSVIFTILMPMILNTTYGVRDVDSYLIVGLVLSSIFPLGMTVSITCQIKANGHHKVLAMGNAFTTYIIALPTSVLFLRSGHPILAVGVFTLISSSLFSLWSYFYREKLAAQRRKVPRFYFPTELRPIFEIENLTHGMRHISSTMLDISHHGCLVMLTSRSSDFEIKCGDHIAGSVNLDGRRFLRIEGRVRRVQVKKSGILERQPVAMIGIEFSADEMTQIDKIDQLISATNDVNLLRAA